MACGYVPEPVVLGIKQCGWILCSTVVFVVVVVVLLILVGTMMRF